MVVSIPPVPGIGDPMLHYEQILRRELVGGNLQWLGYLSSTSVYGDTGGGWVDEDYIPNPASESGRLRLAAEEGWFNFGQSLGISTQVFRLGGIYGPGRSAVDTIVKQGALSESRRMRGHRQFTSRVYVDDTCQAVMASICTPSSRFSVYSSRTLIMVIESITLTCRNHFLNSLVVFVCSRLQILRSLQVLICVLSNSLKKWVSELFDLYSVLWYGRKIRHVCSPGVCRNAQLKSFM